MAHRWNTEDGFRIFSVVLKAPNMTHIRKICALLLYCFILTAALPTSVVEDVKTMDMNRKVKRAPQTISNGEAAPKDSMAFFNPTAIKRGVNMKTDQLPLLTEWDQERYRQAMSDQLPSSLYNSEDDQLDDKTIAEYEKGFRYGTNKDKLDEALENAILKSELYGEPAAINQYRYYGNDDKKRRRRNAPVRKISMPRYKRESDLSPEEILAILTLWQDRQRSPTGYRTSWQRFDPNYDMDIDKDENDLEQPIEEDWLDQPVYPHISEHTAQMSPNYYYDTKPQAYEKRRRWGGFSENKKKRFMVSKKRNDYYTLNDLLGPKREPNNIPLYQRYVL